MTAVAVALGGALGAAARFTLERAVTTRLGHGFPWGTALVNVTGSLAAGVVVGLATEHGLGESVETVVAAGFLGGYTTLSTHAVETVRLVENRRAVRAGAYALGSAALAVGAAALGLAVSGGI